MTVPQVRAAKVPGEHNETARPRMYWATVIKASADSVTVMPESQARRRGAPAEEPKELAVALAKDKTEFAFAEVGMERMMFDGTMMRSLIDPQPATADDLRPGQLVQITPGDEPDAPAKRLMITWSVAGTVVSVTDDELTIRPQARPAARQRADAVGDDKAAPPAQTRGAEGVGDQTVEINKTSTRVRIRSVVGERTEAAPPATNGSAAGGRAGRGPRRFTTVAFRDGALTDLKPGQSVVVCIRDEVATKITINEPAPADETRNAER